MQSSQSVPTGPRPLLAWAAVGAGALVLFALAGLAAPHLAEGPTLCLVRRLSGVPCPGCGLTRACGWLARGELARAWALQPLAPWLLLEGAVAWAWWGAVLLRGARWPTARFGMAVLWTNLLLLLATWAVRWLTGSLQ